MLQQTQVATVAGYFERFLEKFPNVEALAAASEPDVLKRWSGLGYYRRAKNLREAARQVVELHGGQFPKHVEQLRELSGIGRYTAGAIASLAFDARAPILEANTIRLLSRLIGLESPATLSASQKLLWEVAELLLPKRTGSGLMNQGLMELGSLVCKPKNPQCSACPVEGRCQARQRGIQDRIPPLAAKPKKQTIVHAGLILRGTQDRLLLRCNPAGGWWEGLWDLPWVEMRLGKTNQFTPHCFPTLRQLASEQLGLSCEPSGISQTIRHAVTRYNIHYHCVTARLVHGSTSTGKGWRWVRLSRLPPTVARFGRIRFPTA